MIQAPGEIVMLHEHHNPPRQIYTDGRKPPANNDRGWLDAFGHPHSEALHIVERFQRRDAGHLGIEVTIDDPKVYTQSFTVKFSARLLTDSDVLEVICADNEKDRAHVSK